MSEDQRQPRRTPIRSLPGRIAIGPVRFEGRIDLDLLGENPGVDGTTYSQLMMAKAISEAPVGLHVELHCVGEGGSDHVSSRQVQVFSHRTVDDFAAQNTLVIAPVEELAQMEEKNFEGSKIFAVTHHPNSHRLVDICKRFEVWAVIQVGIYSFWSNFRLFPPMLFVPNFLPPELFKKPFYGPPSARSGVSRTVGFVGALVPAKRFHDVANAWEEVVAEFPDAKLQVMGSSSLHGVEGGLHPDLPMSLEYGNQILDSFGVSDASELTNVEFLGNVGFGKEHFIRNWDLAIANPSGNTEAFFGSLRETLLLGIPSIAGARQGGREITSLFPKSGILDKSMIGRRIRFWLRNPGTLPGYQARLLAFKNRSLAAQTQGLSVLISAIIFTLGLRRARLYAFSLVRLPLPPIAVVRALGYEVFLKGRIKFGWVRDTLYRYFLRLSRGLVSR